VLPTGGLARAYGPLAVEDYGSWRQVQELTREGLETIAPIIVELATAEGLSAHARCVQLRFEETSMTAEAVRLATDECRDRRAVRPCSIASSASTRTRRRRRPTGPFPLADARTCTDLNEYPAASYRPLREAAAAYAGVEPSKSSRERVSTTHPPRSPDVPRPRGPCRRIHTDLPALPDRDRTAAERHSRRRRSHQTLRPTKLTSPGSACRTIRPGTVCLIRPSSGSSRQRQGIVVSMPHTPSSPATSGVHGSTRYDHLLVLHTLSKGFGLAGIRVGYAIGNESLIDAIDRVRPPGSISTLSSTLAIAALSDPDRMRRAVADLIVERDRFRDRLTISASTCRRPRRTSSLPTSAPRLQSSLPP
jgi:hypothetical protein